MIWLIGSQGMLGCEIAELLALSDIEFIGTDMEVDITDLRQLTDFAVSIKPVDWIINCSAYTAVDKAESEPEKAYAINAEGVGNIAKIASTLGCRLVHFSTDYVFDGTKENPYNEADRPNPHSVYGKSKLAGERLLQEYHDRYFIFRISWLYGVFGPNFVKTMLRLFAERDELKVINDQFGSPTYAATLAKNTVRFLKSGSDDYGVYLYADKGFISWYDFAVKIRELATEYGLPGKEIKIIPTPTTEYPLPAPRPRNSRFDTSAICQMLKFETIDWASNLASFIRQIKSANCD